MKQTNELCESKTILAFDIMVFEGKICGGCEMIRDLIAEVSFTDGEIAQMRQLVSKLDDALYSEGLMPVLKESAPELYERIDTVVKDMIKRDYSILEGSDMEAYPDYTCDIPVDFLPED